MKQFFKFFLASLLAIIVSFGLLFFIFFIIIGSVISSIGSSTQPTSINKNSILYIDLGQSMNEISHQDFNTFLSGGSSPSGLIEMIRSIRAAKEDKNITGIYLKAQSGESGLSSLSELREALYDFKESGKFIYAYNENISQGTYYLVSVADSVFVNPVGGVELKGLSSSITFFKGALEKLNIEPVIFYCGKYKSATEPYRLKKMSEENKTQITAILNDYWDVISTSIANDRGIDTAKLNDLARNYTLRTAGNALENNIVDGLKYIDEIEALLKEKNGQKEDDKKVNFVTINDYAKTIKHSSSKDKIAILVAEGQIVDGTGSNSLYEVSTINFIKEIHKVRDNDDIKAVVLRINSPGGSALASEEILRELNLLKEKKKLVVSMGDVAASGGYYIACTADSIFATPATITGSIGVFGMMFNIGGLMENKLGVTFDVVKNMPMADFGAMTRNLSPIETQIIQESVDTVYYTFKSHVASGRKMTLEYVDSIGQGRIWSGTQALQLGLVDGIGGLNRAIESAANLAGLNDYSIRVFPSPVNQMEDLLKSLQGINDEDVMITKFFSAFSIHDKFLLHSIKNIKNNKSGIWTVMPYNIVIN